MKDIRNELKLKREDVAIPKMTIEEEKELNKKKNNRVKTQNINNDVFTHDNTTILDYFPLDKKKKKKARTTISPIL